MIPANSPATDLYSPSRFTTGAANDITNLRDSEVGGVDIQDTSRGRLYQFWEARVENDLSEVVISSPTTEPFVHYSGQDITEVSLSFDQLMRPTIVFVEQGIPKMKWFDSTEGGEVVTEYPASYKNPRVTLDDPIASSADSDILFFYLKNGDLCYRQQRDRYTIEYTYATEVGIRYLHKVGMTASRRLQVRGII